MKPGARITVMLTHHDLHGYMALSGQFLASNDGGVAVLEDKGRFLSIPSSSILYLELKDEDALKDAKKLLERYE